MPSLTRINTQLSAVLVFACALAACNEPEQPASFQPQTSISPASSEAATSKTAEPDSATDLRSVQASIDALLAVHGEVRRSVLSTKQYNEEDDRKFDAIFDEPAYGFQSNLWRDLAPYGDERFVSNQPGNARFTVDKIVQSSDDCVWFRATTDETGNLKPDLPTGLVADVVIKRIPHDSSRNTTPWVITQFAPEKLAIVTNERACG